MNDKQIKNLLIVALVVIIVAVAATGLNALQSNSKVEKFAVSEDTVKDADKVEFDSKDNKFALQRTEDQWKVDGIKADSEQVNTFLDLMKSAKVTTTSSTNSNNYELFGVDDENALKLRFYSGENKLSEILLGRALSNGNYIRFENDVNVYQVDKNIASSGDLSANEFKDKAVTSGNLTDLTKIIGEDFQLNMVSGLYEFENDDTEVDQATAQTFANSIINIKAVDLASVEEANSLENRDPNLKFEVMFSNGNDFKFELFAVSDDIVLVKREDGVVLTLYRTQFDSINYNKDKLKQS